MGPLDIQWPDEEGGGDRYDVGLVEAQGQGPLNSCESKRPIVHRNLHILLQVSMNIVTPRGPTRSIVDGP